jgi:hypothetical protein
MSKVEFIGYTVGIAASSPTGPRALKVEFNRCKDGSVLMRAVSAHNLANAGKGRVISAEEFSSRPVNPFNSTREAIWALEKLGFRVAD